MRWAEPTRHEPAISSRASVCQYRTNFGHRWPSGFSGNDWQAVLCSGSAKTLQTQCAENAVNKSPPRTSVSRVGGYRSGTAWKRISLAVGECITLCCPLVLIRPYFPCCTPPHSLPATTRRVHQRRNGNTTTINKVCTAWHLAICLAATVSQHQSGEQDFEITCRRPQSLHAPAVASHQPLLLWEHHLAQTPLSSFTRKGGAATASRQPAPTARLCIRLQLVRLTILHCCQDYFVMKDFLVELLHTVSPVR